MGKAEVRTGFCSTDAVFKGCNLLEDFFEKGSHVVQDALEPLILLPPVVWTTSGFIVRQKGGGQGLMHAMYARWQVSSTSNPSFLIQYFFLNEACTMAQWVKARASQA